MREMTGVLKCFDGKLAPTSGPRPLRGNHLKYGTMARKCKLDGNYFAMQECLFDYCDTIIARSTHTTSNHSHTTVQWYAF